MWCPSVEDVLRMHRKIIKQTGGADGVRSMALIESAIQRFYAAYGGHEAYKAVEEKAAAVACGLIQNHGFVDGNKRIGVGIMRLILAQNGVRIIYTQADLIAIALSVASGNADVEQMAGWIRARMPDHQ